MSLEEQLDTSSAVGELVFHVFGAIAHFERRLISERTPDGIAAARRRGRTPGRPPLDPDTISAGQKLIDAGLSPRSSGKAARHWQGNDLQDRCLNARRSSSRNGLMFATMHVMQYEGVAGRDGTGRGTAAQAGAGG